MDQKVEIVGVTDQDRIASALGGVSGIMEFEELRFSGREWGFQRLYSGEEHVLKPEDVIEIMAFNGIRKGQENWSIMRMRVGSGSRLKGPLSWRPVRNSDRWTPAPVEAAILMNWVKVSVSAFIIAAATCLIFSWLIEGIMSGGLATTLSSATMSVIVIIGSLIYLMRSWRQVMVARKVARIQADGSIFVAHRSEAF